MPWHSVAGQGPFTVVSASGRVGAALAARLGDVMELTDAQYARIAPLLPKPRGKLTIPERQVLNALFYLAEHGCKWRGLPERFGPWHTIYMRLNRWAKAGVLARVLAELPQELLAELNWDALCLDSTIIKLHPDAAGAPRKGGAKRSAGRAGRGGRPSSTPWSPTSARR